MSDGKQVREPSPVASKRAAVLRLARQVARDQQGARAAVDLIAARVVPRRAAGRRATEAGDLMRL